jgi:hypothetical protein
VRIDSGTAAGWARPSEVYNYGTELRRSGSILYLKGMGAITSMRVRVFYNKAGKIVAIGEIKRDIQYPEIVRVSDCDSSDRS